MILAIVLFLIGLILSTFLAAAKPACIVSRAARWCWTDWFVTLVHEAWFGC